MVKLAARNVPNASSLDLERWPWKGKISASLPTTKKFIGHFGFIEKLDANSMKRIFQSKIYNIFETNIRTYNLSLIIYLKKNRKRSTAKKVE